MTLKEFLEECAVKYTVNEIPTSEISFKHPGVARLRDKEYEKGNKFFYPYSVNGVIINKPDVKVMVHLEWTLDEYNKLIESLSGINVLKE